MNIDVFVLSYNNSKFIESTIQSILSNNTSIRLTVIDDCSTDDSVIILNKLQSKFNFALIINEKNKGVVFNVQLAIGIAQSEFTCIHSSDDLSLPSRFEHQASKLRQYPDAKFICSKMGMLNKNNKITQEYYLKRVNLIDLLKRNIETNISVLYRTSSLKGLKLNDQMISEEPQIYYECLKDINSYALFDNKLCYLYRIHADNLTSNKMELMLNQHIDLLVSLPDRYKFYSNSYIYYIRSLAVGVIAERSKVSALLYLFNYSRCLAYPSIFRSILKILIPKSLHMYFKR
jgi:glycosyltransferase involved in cell wall biosynthesis